MKSKHHFIPAKRRSKNLPLLSSLGWLLITLQLLFVPAALAISSRANATPPLSQQGILELSGVSVMRLLIFYSIGKSQPLVTCTTLGTIIASWLA